MLSLHLHPDQIEWLVGELRKAGDREIGGVLVGEHMGQDTFRLADLSVQRAGGTKSCFVCEPKRHESFLQEFFDRTGHAFTRFNYIGEWHSHPFNEGPSSQDVASLHRIGTSAKYCCPFPVLLLCRHRGRTGWKLESYQWNGARPVQVTLMEIEDIAP